MDQWRQPDRQHDMAEYLVFLTTCPLVNFQRVTLHWQARTAERDGRVRISDIGHSVPLVLLPPCTKAWIVFLLSPCRIWCFSGIRSMIINAAWAVPSAIILQVGRFHYDKQRGLAIKRRYRVVPSPVLEFPVFEQGMQCRNEVLQLNSAVIHLGEARLTVTIVHCCMMLFNRDSGLRMITLLRFPVGTTEYYWC